MGKLRKQVAEKLFVHRPLNDMYDEMDILSKN